MWFKYLIIVLVIAIPAFIGVFLVSAQAKGAVLTNKRGVAIQGYDPVAYFEEGEAVRGNPSISVEYEGVTYYFAHVKNKERFLHDAEMYLPAYGGYCAWAVSRGYTAGIDPQAWVIHEGRLMLNYSKRIGERFQKNLLSNVQKADMNWPSIKKKLTQ